MRTAWTDYERRTLDVQGFRDPKSNTPGLEGERVTVLLSVIVTTIGRPELMRALVDSLIRSELRDLEFILVDQSDDQRSAQVVRELNPPFPFLLTKSERGASIGRNAGLALARAPFVTFPDDGCSYPSESLALAVNLLQQKPELAGLSGILSTEGGKPSLLRWPEHACRITVRNFYRTKIESTLFFRREQLIALGGFDPLLGTGSASPYQSGEISDLVIRGLRAQQRYDYDPRVVVYHPDVEDDLTTAYVGKMGGYGRGFGRIFAQYGLSRPLLAGLLARRYVGSIVRQARGQRLRAQADRSWVHGALQGFRQWRRENPTPH